MPTPRLVVERAVLDANIRRTADWARRLGLDLRPHVKTHKSVDLARLQLEAGAVGITVATVGEAEVFAAAGFDDVFIAYPLWIDDDRAERLRRLAGTTRRLAVGVDSVASAERLSRLPVDVLVEVDSGHHRTGVAPPDVARVAERVGDRLRGVFSFPGHSYSPDATTSAGADEAGALAEARDVLAGGGLAVTVLSGGSTPSLATSDAEVLTEVRPGVYVFNDAQQWELGTCSPDDVALTCHATVVSHAGGRLVLDSGSKVLGADRAPYASGFGRLLDHPDARIVLLSEHHAVAEVPGPLPPLGSTVRVVPNHVCNAVNLVDTLWVDGASWPVSARGRND
ncbi:MAG: METAL-ACTIVATED PYRIDOXAL ENZYME [uncultured Nocardioides sp.]|uniref:METAL-ACTIVATED PYRIDOXAL ENZYME n=1 Tax=uncultured Nocardioides sp. TaxID=198441 RepID=A0A6J4N497_9ACTN|nr:MAG: METAL-ACTIVATED PYRIDOXAL ENZYME [uncultured Nocardioides sp.]